MSKEKSRELGRALHAQLSGCPPVHNPLNYMNSYAGILKSEMNSWQSSGPLLVAMLLYTGHDELVNRFGADEYDVLKNCMVRLKLNVGTSLKKSRTMQPVMALAQAKKLI